MQPSFLIGGIAENFGSSFQLGQGKHFILEGDEYDTAFFDKGPKFLHYFPDAVILTSVEFDHADIYKDLDAVETAFKRLVNLVPRRGRIIAFDSRRERRSGAWRRRFVRWNATATRQRATWRMTDLRLEPDANLVVRAARRQAVGRFRVCAGGRVQRAGTPPQRRRWLRIVGFRRKRLPMR